jgi:hypothetical protein
VLVGVCLVVAIYTFSLQFPRWKPTAVEKNLFSVFLGTIALFGYVFQWGWRYRRTPKFWLAFAALAFFHCAIFASLSFYVDHWSALVLGPTVGVEAIAMAAVIHWAIDEKRV